MSDFKRILFIINPHAGIQKKENVLPDIINVFEDYGYETTVVYTRKSGDGTTLTEKHADESIDIIVCMGGDGTLNEVFAGARSIRWSKPIGYIPAGSTNDFASSLGLPSDPKTAAEHIMTRKARHLDLGSFNGRYFVYTASAGAFTRTSYETPQKIKNVLGHFAYLLEGVKDFTQLHTIHMRINTDSKSFSGDYLFVAFCNTFSLGGVMSLDEMNVELDDGEFELITVSRPKDLIQFNTIIKLLYDQGYDETTELVTITKVRKADIHFPAAEDWSLDGEKGEGSELVEFHVVPGAVRFIY